MNQITLKEWMPSACPGTPEYEAANKRTKKAKRFTAKENPVVKPKPMFEMTEAQMMNVRENWYALLAAIVRDWDDDLPAYNKDGSIKKDKNGETVWVHKAHDPNYPYYTSADDALAAMGVKRQYNAK